MRRIGKRKNEGGAILAIVIIGIVAIIVAITYFAGENLEAQTCKNQLETIQHWNNRFIESKAGGAAGDAGLCRQMNALIDKYNASRCAKNYGELPKEKCPE